MHGGRNKPSFFFFLLVWFFLRIKIQKSTDLPWSVSCTVATNFVPNVTQTVVNRS